MHGGTHHAVLFPGTSLPLTDRTPILQEHQYYNDRRSLPLPVPSPVVGSLAQHSHQSQSPLHLFFSLQWMQSVLRLAKLERQSDDVAIASSSNQRMRHRKQPAAVTAVSATTTATLCIQAPFTSGDFFRDRCDSARDSKSHCNSGKRHHVCFGRRSFLMAPPERSAALPPMHRAALSLSPNKGALQNGTTCVRCH